jgi:hypothetical protein
MRTRDIIEVIHVVENAKKKIDKMNEKYPKKYRDELEEIGRSVISEWYATYDPIYYHNRQMGLKHAWKVSLNGTNYSVEFGPELMDSSYHQSTEIIFNNAFMDGYHGGSFHNGIPYWRTPYPDFTEWGRPALRSFSPYSRMVSEMNKKIKEIDKQKQDEFDQIINKVQKSINRLR